MSGERDSEPETGGSRSGEGQPGGDREIRDEELREQVGDLAETLGELESELREERRRPRLDDLVRFTREVTIPAVILVLRTNIEALKLLQRALSFGEDGGGGGELRRRAEEAGRSALDDLDDALDELGSTLSGRSGDGRARDLLAEARDLQREVEAELDRGRDATTASEPVDIDVDAELQSIKDEVDDEDSD